MIINITSEGWVKYISHYGADDEVVDAAMASTGKESKDPIALINYMMEHHHSTPFRVNQIKLQIKMPIFVARQVMRHNIGITWNELSGRYGELPQEMYVPDEVHIQSTKNKQGSAEIHLSSDGFTYDIEFHNEESREMYDFLIANGVAFEEARMVLPVTQYTIVQMTASQEAIYNFLELRMDSHAQGITRQYAEAIYKIVANIWPAATEAFNEFRLHSYTLSRKQVRWLQAMIANQKPSPEKSQSREWQKFSEMFGNGFFHRSEQLGFNEVPTRYTEEDGTETIDKIRIVLGTDGFLSYCFGNYIKYKSRGDTEKPGSLDKAKWYAQMYCHVTDPTTYHDPRHERPGFVEFGLGSRKTFTDLDSIFDYGVKK